jgi:ketosteroid isomerase-like protein
MKKLILTQLLIIVSAFTAIAQTADERELMKFITDYDEAYMKNDIAFAERNLAEDYILVIDGERRTREELVAEIKKESAARAKFERDLRSKNETLRVVGDVAVATGLIEWKETPKQNPRNEANSGQERYTLVWERRGRRWLLLSEHISSIRRDRKAMEAEVRKASDEYTEMIRRRDAASIERVLSEEFVLTTEAGQIRNKAQELEDVKSNPNKLESLTMSEQKIRIYSGNIAVETGKFHYKGADKDGKSHTGVGRYTTTWIRRDGRWQIVSDHLSEAKE